MRGVVAAVAVLALALLMPLARSTGASAGRSRASLRILYSDPRGLGAEHFLLRCSPPAGTFPNPRRACAAIAAEPALLHPTSQRGHSCPAGEPWIQISGDADGAPVNAGFSPCASTTPEGLLETWFSLLPSEVVVRPGRGLGPLYLGERRATVVALLGGGTPVTLDEVTYAADRQSNGRGSLGLRYSVAGRLSEIVDNARELSLYGENLSTAVAPHSALGTRIARWTPGECAGQPSRALPAGASALTSVLVGEAPAVIIAAPRRGACHAARSLLG